MDDPSQTTVTSRSFPLTRPEDWTSSSADWRRMYGFFLRWTFLTPLGIYEMLLNLFWFISLCAGVCGSRYSVRAWGWTGGSGGVCALHQWIHHWQRARLSGGPGGLCSSPGAAVWAPGAFGLDAVLALSFSESHSSEDAITLELMSNITNVFVYFSYLNCFRYFK